MLVVSFSSGHATLRCEAAFGKGDRGLRGFAVPHVDASLCYHDLPGDDPPLVFLHGLGGASSEAFVHLVRHPRLQTARVLLVDLLGFGYSERPQDFGYTIEEHADSVAALIEHLGLRSVHLVGHSMGGSVAIALASRSRHLIGGLVVAEGTLDPGGGGRIGHRVAAQREEDYVHEGHATVASGLEKALGGNPAYLGVLRTIRMAAPHAMHRTACDAPHRQVPYCRSVTHVSLGIADTGDPANIPDRRAVPA
jgi:pimeloyl-ACP methyl ester carboxylesterase